MNRRLVLPAGNLLGTVAWSFVSVSLPFHVRAISDVDAAATLRWTGFILGITGFGLLRFLQVLCVAPVFPIVVARIAHRAGGGAIGVINSARIGAAFIGPVAATTLLAWTSPLILYACLGAVGAACVPVAWRGERAASAIART